MINRSLASRNLTIILDMQMHLTEKSRNEKAKMALDMHVHKNGLFFFQFKTLKNEYIHYEGFSHAENNI